ncbi:uncharacterized protein LOC121918556 [Sceloporus undulatus]|uniref:uncharacterized protein LOC121918556 n=1 Tax=Sceloporus undulatus TaxID=8520 RepID=UPI001C4ABC25|nr:uncharacterized protein LOC121918556 [Sceloporus undulatus]
MATSPGLLVALRAFLLGARAQNQPEICTSCPSYWRFIWIVIPFLLLAFYYVHCLFKRYFGTNSTRRLRRSPDEADMRDNASPVHCPREPRVNHRSHNLFNADASSDTNAPSIALKRHVSISVTDAKKSSMQMVLQISAGLGQINPVITIAPSIAPKRHISIDVTDVQKVLSADGSSDTRRSRANRSHDNNCPIHCSHVNHKCHNLFSADDSLDTSKSRANTSHKKED